MRAAELQAGVRGADELSAAGVSDGVCVRWVACDRKTDVAQLRRSLLERVRAQMTRAENTLEGTPIESKGAS